MSGEVCTITASSEADCLAQLSSRFGPKGYSVLSKTKVRSGFWLFAREKFEIQYTVETHYSPQYSQGNFSEQRDRILERVNLPKVLCRQMEQMQQTLDEIKQSNEERNSQGNVLPAEQESILQIREILAQNEFSQEYIEKVCEKIKSELSLSDIENPQIVQQKVVEWIGDSIKTDIFEFKRGKKQAVALVGTTGVGKSTTTVKLAGVFSMVKEKLFNPRLKISVISTDFVKPGAHDQVEKFCLCMRDVGVEFFKTKSYGEIPESLNYHRYLSDLTFIDTRGFAPKDFTELARLQQSLITQGLPIDIFLTVAASTQGSAIETALKSFEIFNCRSVIITKLDEAEKIGGLISVLAKKEKRVSYISDTQEVPVIYEANPIILLRKLVGFEVDWAAIESRFCAEKSGADAQM